MPMQTEVTQISDSSLKKEKWYYSQYIYLDRHEGAQCGADGDTS